MRYNDGREFSLLEPNVENGTPNKKEQVKIFILELALIIVYIVLVTAFGQLVYIVAKWFFKPPIN